MHKKGLKTYKDLIKIFILLSSRQDMEIEIAIIITANTCILACSHNNLHKKNTFYR